MRNILFLLTICVNTLFSQEVVLLDNVTKLPVEKVNITSPNNLKGVVSNKSGIINLDIFNSKDTLIIRHLAYQEIRKIKSKLKKKTIFLTIKPHSLENITISDSRSNNLKETFTYLRKKRSEILNSQSAQSSQLLEKTMGVSVQNSQSGGGSPNLRGMEANRLLIVVDGIPLNNTIFRSGHVQSSSTINPVFLESFNIAFGPSSVAYGDGAMGGAILFNTKDPSNTNNTTVIQQYESSSNSVFTSGLLNLKLKNTINLIGFSIKSYGELKMGGNRLHGFQDWGKNELFVEENIQKETDYQQFDFLYKSLFQINKNSFILFNSQFSTSSNINRFDKLNDIQDEKLKYKYWYYGPQKRLFQSLRFKHYFSSLFYDNLTLTAAVQKIEESRHKQKTTDALLNNRKEKLTIIDFRSDFSKKFPLFKLHYGCDFRAQGLISRGNLSSNNTFLYNSTRYPDGGTTVLNGAVYTQTNINFSRKLLCTTGFRYSINSLSAIFNDTSIIDLPFNQIKLNNRSLSTSIQFIFYLNNTISFNSSVSNGFRNPNTDDVGKIFSKNDLYVVIPTDKLSPEKSTTIESGIKIKLKNKLSLQAQIFQTNIKNAIEKREASLNGLDSIFYDGEMMRIIMNTNIGRARIRGVSFAYQFNITKYLSQSGTINLLKGSTLEGDPLAHIPPANIISELNYTHSNHFISLNIHYNHIKKAIDYDLAGVDNLEEATIIGSPSWYTINFKYRLSIDENLILISGVNNIMDTHYKTFGSGISASGRNFTVSLQANF